MNTRRNHATQKVRIAGQRTLDISVHDAPQPVELFLRIKGPDYTSELIALYDVMARLSNIAPQYGVRLRRWAISSLEPNLPRVAPSSGTDVIF